jgi:hypothetical protein
MKKMFLGLLLMGSLLAVSSVAGRAGTEMVSPSYNTQADPGYWVPAPAPPAAAYYYPPAPYYAGPPPYYYYAPRPPVYYGGYYGYGPGVHIYAPGIFFGFGFHGRR